MTLLVISALLTIVLYMGAMVYTGRKIPESVSATVFLLPRAGQWLFTIVMWIVGFTLLPSLLEKVSEQTQFLAFIMIAGVMFVGAAPLLANERNTIHYVFAAIAGLSSQLLVALNQPLFLLTWMLYVGYTLFAKDVRLNFLFAEVICMTNIFAYCLTH